LQRDLSHLADTPFDLLIIGAGIYGVTAAWDAAQRGLSVALIDRGDIGGGTSFHNLKTVHGGLRSLQSGSLREMRQFIRERRALSRIAPHLVHPLPFLIPTYREWRRGRTAMRIALTINDLVARDRNALPDPSKHLPPGHIISREECLRLHPLVDPRGVTGGAVWHDCQMYSTDRVTLSFALSAVQQGATAANYVAAERLLRARGRVAGVRARDRLAGGEFDIRARVVMNATGPWAPQLAARLVGHRSPLAPQLSRAMNLITRRITDRHALGGLVGSRFFFVVPWRQWSIIGTSHDPYHGDADQLAVTAADVEQFLLDARLAFPRAGLVLDDVRLVHRGLLPAIAARPGHVDLLKSSVVHEHAAEGAPGLVTVLGVRYTTARDTARRAVDTAFAMLGRTAPPCRTAELPLAGGDIRRFDEFLDEQTSDRRLGLTPETARRLAFCYGTVASALRQRMAEEPDLAGPLSATCAVTRAEIRHAVRAEMAMTLSDAVLRRTEAGSAGHPGRDALAAAAAVMAAELGWPADRIGMEIAEVEGFYRIDP
jgi:glycerol-3-phosphate dehydrogenase